MRLRIAPAGGINHSKKNRMLRVMLSSPLLATRRGPLCYPKVQWRLGTSKSCCIKELG